ncbi:MAG: hypothetical protein COA78_07250 [Blastopirellula sp.]|nr:MAG: hypothetical protein COA78_07250 [Blastopirellula sp.]
MNSSETDCLTVKEEELVSRFEKAWFSSQIPNFGDYLNSSSSIAVITELVMIDIECRIRLKERHQLPQLEIPVIVFYTQELNEIGISYSPSNELYLEEYRIRCNNGQHVSPSEYCKNISSEHQPSRTCLNQIVERAKIEQKNHPHNLVSSESMLDNLQVQRADYAEFTLQQFLGAGSCGRVYQAWWKKRNKKIAVKALYKSLQHDPLSVHVFLREVEILSNLQVESVVGLQALGTFPNGNYFMLLDFIEGGTLRANPSIQQASIETKLKLFLKIVTAVEQLHQSGVIHCDLKPDNILLDLNGIPYVADFGLAKLSDSYSGKASTAILGGSLGYMAPEQFKSTALVGPQADVFGLGGILYFLMTGNDPSENRIEKEESEVMKLIRQCREENVDNRIKSVAELKQLVIKLPVRT